MKYFNKLFILPLLAVSLSSCAFSEFNDNDKDVVDLGNDDAYVRWNLIENNNDLRPVTSAYFEFAGTSFKYYEDGSLKKEGSARTLYHGLENSISQLFLGLNTTDGVYIDGYIECFTEDTKDNLHQFTMMTMGYKIKAKRSGGVPVRDYHLSDMPYAFGTYLKEETEQYTYTHEKVSPLYQGTFVDESGNKFYFVNNSYKNDSGVSYLNYTIYFRYENNINHTSIEGTLGLSGYDDFELGYRKVALLYIMHGESEPSEEKGVSEFPDYELKDFIYDESNNTISFTSARYFDDEECDYNPANFIAGTYTKAQYGDPEFSVRIGDCLDYHDELDIGNNLNLSSTYTLSLKRNNKEYYPNFSDISFIYDKEYIEIIDCISSSQSQNNSEYYRYQFVWYLKPLRETESTSIKVLYRDKESVSINVSISDLSVESSTCAVVEKTLDYIGEDFPNEITTFKDYQSWEDYRKVHQDFGYIQNEPNIATFENYEYTLITVRRDNLGNNPKLNSVFIQNKTLYYDFKSERDYFEQRPDMTMDTRQRYYICLFRYPSSLDYSNNQVWYSNIYKAS